MPDSVSSGFAITTRRPVAILMVVMAVCVFGAMSYQRLALNLMPDISYPTLTVRTAYPGTAPEEIETIVSRPLEQALGVLPHLVSISSISKAGQSDVVLEFEWDTQMNDMSQEIREKIDRSYFPDGVERPLLLRYDPSQDPILRIGLHGSQTLFALRQLAEHEIKRELEAIPGVAAVKIKGGLEEEIHVALNERRLGLMGLDISQINTRLAQDNVNMPGGNLREGQTSYLIRTLNEFGSVQEIADLVVAQQNGVDVRLKDIAAVYRAHKDRQIITRVNGRESVEIEIYKEGDANIVAVAERVHNRLYGLPQQREYVEKEKKEEEEKEKEAAEDEGEEEGGDEDEEEEETGSEVSDDGGDWEEQKRQAARRTREHQALTDFISYRLPQDTQLEILSDQSVFIVNSIEEVQNSALIGGAMAVLVLFIFLRNAVHTGIIGLTIPVSVVATFAPMYIFDVSLNIMSLGGLALGVGMLVDNSIVVLESIFRCREEGDNLIAATVRGTGEVGSAVVASTLTTIAVFFPIVFVEGIAGQVFSDMSLTVVFSLLASLGVALFFIPMLASRQLQQSSALEKLGASAFLHLHALERARRAAKDAELSRLGRFGRVLLALPYLLYEVLWRLLLIVATLVAAVLKIVLILLVEVLWPLIKPIEYFLVKPQRTLQSRVVAWAQDNYLGLWWVIQRRWSRAGSWGTGNLFEQVWPAILSLGAAPALAGDMQDFWGWITRSRLFGRILKAPLFPLVLVYLVFRFAFHSVLGLVGTVLQLALLLVGLVLVLALFLLAMVLLPVFMPLLLIFEGAFGLIQRAYPAVLGFALRQRFLVVLTALASFLYCWFELVPKLGTELIPQVHQGEFNLEVTLPVGTPLEKTAETIAAIEAVVERQEEVQRFAAGVGTDESATSASDEGEHTGRITIKLQQGSTPQTEQVLIERLRRQLRDLPETEIEVSHPALFSFKTPVEVELRGKDLRQLRRLSRRAEAALQALPGLADVKSSLQTGNPELRIIYDRRRLAEYGLFPRAVAELVRHKVQGKVATDFRQDEQLIDILVRLRPDDRLGLEELRRLVINPNGEIPIPLEAVARIQVDEGPSEIRRIDQQRAALITANIRDIDLGTASAQIDRVLQTIDFPPSFSYLIGGQNREMETSLKSLLFALALALFLVYVVMASQFESLVHPFIIMFTVPLALIGVVVVLYVVGVALSVVVFIGLIMLAGIVVNNAIVLVDYINTLRRSGVEKMAAIVQASSVRLRPIAMTTATTVLGLLPMALGLGEGAEIRTPMALTVIAGLISSTFLTLVVIPTVYSLVDRRP